MLSSFKKTDGQSAQVLGVSVYEMAFDAEVTFPNACKWLRGLSSFGNLEFKTRELPKNTNTREFTGWDGWFEMSQFPGVLVKDGAVAAIAGTLIFARSERGWNLERVDGNVVSQPEQLGGQGPEGARDAGTPSLPASPNLERASSSSTAASCERRTVCRCSSTEARLPLR